MAPIKNEEDMKKRLEKRTIQPSAKAWETLSQRLDNEEKKHNKKGLWWLGIAASIVGILLVTNLFFSSKTNNNNTIIVNQNKTQNTQKIEKQEIERVIPKNEVIVEVKRNIKKTNSKNLKVSNELAINNNSKKTPIKNKETLNNLPQNNTIITEIKIPKIKKQPIERDEVDMLLAQATESIKSKKTINKHTPIDHNELLIAVEDDLDERFRDKILKTVRKGYQTVKESVAERNE
ncbi:hypothetical protein CLV86_0818 [Lacinutrix venerupis]|uniref:hypothetical protein n=1 Tax=Lacinutrix venerupis TaxID=1486034 RepID=UPI000EAB61A3|nr:hypothetical protein [Lacinutrix venerupis]RLJ67321.1 hypothetical protein CLV86_0818 [Lacinutrix venerupis]